jgi:hypothetical protein
MLVGIGARIKALLWGGILLLITLLFQTTAIFNLPDHEHLFLWTDPFKELTLSGGFFVVAGSLSSERNTSAPIKFLENLIPLGKYFLAITMVLFGIMHFVYPSFVAPLVPNWIPWHMFWTYFAAIALIAAGLGIILNVIKYFSTGLDMLMDKLLRLSALLLGIMLFLWVIILHIPRGIADPHSGNGNEWTSVFEALAFSGIAFLLAGKTEKSA